MRATKDALNRGPNSPSHISYLVERTIDLSSHVQGLVRLHKLMVVHLNLVGYKPMELKPWKLHLGLV